MALSAEDLAAIVEAITPSLDTKISETVVGALGKPLNDAISKRLGQFEKTFSTTVEGSIGKALDGFKQTLPASGSTTVPEAKDPNSVALKTMETKLETALTKLADADNRAKAERAKNRTASINAAVADHLSKLGMTDPVGLKLAVGHLTTVEKRTQYEDEDNDNARILFRNDDDTLMDLGVGLKKWATTPEAKLFMPATGVRGSGSNPTSARNVVSGGNKPTKEQQEGIIYNALAEALGRGT
jgi:hypothetical protein